MTFLLLATLLFCTAAHAAPCSIAVHCSGHATYVSGVAPDCFCGCRNQWNPADRCATCPAQFGGSDCNTCGAGMLGSRYPVCAACSPQGYCGGHAVSAARSASGACVCTCSNFWIGQLCERCPSEYAGSSCDRCARPGYVVARI